MIRDCDGVCRHHEDGTPITAKEPMSETTIRSRYSEISDEDWDRIFKHEAKKGRKGPLGWIYDTDTPEPKQETKLPSDQPKAS